MGATINVELINPFLIAAKQILKDVCSIEVAFGRPFVKDADFSKDEYGILIGLTGEVKGQVIIALQEEHALKIASTMCMMAMESMNEIAVSAICELGNMILGNAATVFSAKGIEMDITPPTVSNGDVTFRNNFAKNISIPLVLADQQSIEINVAIKD